MIRAIVWKEFREQGLIGLTLVAFGAGILVAAATFAEPATQGANPADVVRFLGAGLLAAMMLSVTAGTVCGGALFAAEREAGTIGFLESLPVSRWRIWRAKIAAGSLLAFIQIGFVLGIAAALGLIATPGWAFAITVFAMLAFVWGAYGSTLAHTTLGSVGFAMTSGTAAFIFFLLPVWLLFPTRNNMLQTEGQLIFLALMFAAPLIGSAIRYTRSDRERTADELAPVRTAPKRSRAKLKPAPVAFDSRRPRFGLLALLWLSWKQLAKPGLVIAAFAAVLGLALLAENIQPVMVWPSLGLAAGVLAGVTMFMDEQTSGSSRYWGERRLPIGRLWLVKLAVHAAFALMLGVLLLLPSAIQSVVAGWSTIRGGGFLSSMLRNLLFENAHLGSQGWKLLALPLVYGFAAGHLCGLLFRKTVVAAGVAGVVGGSLAAFWVPSLLSGGTKHWQLWAAPIIAILTARLILRAWSAERLPTRRPLTALVAGFASILLVQAAGLGWRVIEVPDVPGSEDDLAYIASLPPLEAVDSGRQFRTAAERFTRVSQSVPAFPKQPATLLRGTLEERLANSPYQAWVPADAELADWVEKVYSLDTAAGDMDDPWFVQAGKAGREPADGIFEHPLRTGTSASLQTQANGRRMGLLLLAHGLHGQARGDSSAFPEDLRTVLALGRTFRKGSVVVSLGYGNDVSRAAYSAADRWLAAFKGPHKHLRAAIRVLEADDAVPPYDPRLHLLAERYVLRDLAKAPGQFLPAQITPPGRDKDQNAAVVDLIGVAWNVPWERERGRRLMGMGFERGQADDATRELILGRPGANIFLSRKQTPDDMIEADRQLRLHRRSILLMAAIRLHALERRTAPASLDDLVRLGYLSAVPLDPYGNQAFRYRISGGETIHPPPMPVLPGGTNAPAGPKPKELAAGQPVLWSVGPDGADGGGRNWPSEPGSIRLGADLVFLPLLPDPKP